MTVKEFSEIISKFPPDAEIAFNAFDSDWFDKGFISLTYAATDYDSEDSDSAASWKRLSIEFNMPGYKSS